MDFRFSHFFQKSSFIYRNGTPGAPPRPGTVGPAEDEDEEQRREQQELERERLRDRQALQTQVSRAQVSPEIKQRMRECLASDNLERQNLVAQFLSREIQDGQAFLRDLDQLEHDEESWATIFDTQREVRRKIQELQYRAESYVELLPHKKSIFETMLKSARGINHEDDKTDRSLRRELHGLVTQNAQRNPPVVLNKEEANEIYQVDPLSVGFEKTLKKYQSRIEASPSGKSIFRRLLAMKKEEARVERQFNILYTQFDKLIQQNLSQVRRKAERERILKTASKVTGITLREGVTIRFDDPEMLTVGDRENTAKIARIEWENVTIRDRKGKAIDVIPGIPFITLSTKPKAKMPLGRFKKWADASDAVEDISSISDVEEKTGLKAYGIKIEKDMELCYSRRTQDQQGKITTSPVVTRISKIENGRIHFEKPVLFAPGLGYLDQNEERDSLSLGEFVKWWHRYEVEKSVGLEELQKLLIQFNEMDNKQFGFEPKNNPPILVKEHEELRYPDEGGDRFRIVKVDTDGVTLSNGLKYSFPEFFYWVKNNNVEKVPEREKTPEEVAEEEARQHEITQARESDKKAQELEQHAGMQQLEATVKFHKEREAGSLIGRLKDIWWTTQFLSLKDLWNMTKEIVEFVKRKHERRSKGRYGDVGSRLPWVIGPEFERVKQAAENEEVNKYKEAMEHWSVEKVKRTLNETGSKDIAKACIMTLLHHGEMRWDDHGFWKTLNRLTAHYTLKGAQLYIPSPEHMPPKKNGEDMTVAAIDALWGEGQASQWIQENISKYNSNKNNFEYIFKQTENDPKGIGGPAGRCRDLLATWRQGGYVNPQEYEEMIDAAIKYGKMSAEGKMFFIIAGVLARQGNKDSGETLLHLDRLGELDSKYLNQFPILDFFTTKHIFDPTIWNEEKKEWGVLRKPNKLSDYERWMQEYFPDDFKKGEPAAQFSRFMWEVIMPNEEVRTRMSKGIRNAENMDHDDAHLNIPPLTPTEVDNVTTGPSGQKKYFTNEGYMNAYPGFNHYIVSLSYLLEEERDEKKKQNYLYALRDTLNGFIRYDAILDNRFKRSEKDHRARLDDRHFKRKTVVGGSVLCGEYQAQVRNIVIEIARAYGENLSWLYGKKYGLDAEGERNQREYETKVEQLKDKIADMIQSDEGVKAVEAIKRARALAEENERDSRALSGIPESRRPKPKEVERLRIRAQQARLESAAGGGHGGH